MAKISFNKLALSGKNESVKTLEYNGQNIEVKQYLSVEEKATLIDTVVAKSMSEKGFFNPYKLNIITNFEIIRAYTNITFTEKQMTENFFKTYDALAFELMEMIFNEIPEKELSNIFSTVRDVSEAITKYNNSVMGLLAQVAQNYENVNFNLDKIAEVLGDPSNLEMVKKMLENV